MDDDEVKAMNRRVAMGWEPTTHQWKAVAERCEAMPDMCEQKVWGIRVWRRYKAAPRGKPALPVETHEIVANPQFFHPSSIKASDLTYDEAEALIKLLES